MKSEIFGGNFNGFTHGELEKSFDLVKPETHWKDEIRAYCTSQELPAVLAAIEFFTGTSAGIDFVSKVDSEFQGRFKKNDLVFIVRAIGYRKGPAGDH